MTILSFVSMYIFMYAMVDRFENVYLNLNKVYMAGLMTVPMLILEIIIMRAMYHNSKVNSTIITCSAILLVAFFLSIRNQTAIGDKQFLRSMIPHHAGALLMCEEANITDQELKTLCSSIRESQQREIDQMNRILARLK